MKLIVIAPSVGQAFGTVLDQAKENVDQPHGFN
jgi:hypothetical protein